MSDSPSTAIPTDAYTPYGAAFDLLHLQAPEVLIAGPSGTGKSRASLFKLHVLADQVPGFRGLILRKTRASLTQSALVTFEGHVVPRGHPCLGGARRANRNAYRYPNGSEIALGGLGSVEEAGRVMSTEFDCIYIQEAIELSEGEWEALTTRLRNGRLPYQQLIGDTNPSSPRHWLKLRCDRRLTILLESRHEDNPRYWDRAKGTWTPDGATYIAKLDALTGPRKPRLRFGRWVQAEGVVYEGFDPAIHLIDRFPIPNEWPRLLAIDFGFTNPFTCQWWAIDPDGRLYRYREIYHTKRLVEDHARRIRELHGSEPEPLVICDHDAEDRATLERHLGWPTFAAFKSRAPGFQAVAARLRKAGDGRPRLFFLRDSLDERDQELSEAKKPCCTEEEFDGYCWKNNSTKEEPVKEMDHGLDSCRYVCAGVDGLDGQSAGGEDEEATVLQIGG